VYALRVQTRIPAALADDPRVIEIEAILRKCVHCGMCLATCPTYTLLGDELDSPRGRIYQIKQVVEGQAPTRDTLEHLDRCLTCRNCETTCPSGVQYGHLVDAGRSIVEERVPRPLPQRLMRRALLQVLPHRGRVGPLVRVGQAFRGLLPAALRASVPVRQDAGTWPAPRHAHRLLVLDGCVQPAMTPATNAAAARVLDACGVSLISVPRAGCCGAVPYHLNEQDDALDHMRRNIDAWWPLLDGQDGQQPAIGVLATASGCGVMLKEYGHVLAADPHYADKAARLSAAALDTVQAVQHALAELPEATLQAVRQSAASVGAVAFHPPCTLQHGQRLAGVTEALLRRLGFSLTRVADSNLCCGSAGTYSIFQPGIARQLRDSKVSALEAGKPAIVATANIGCQLHLGQGVAQSSDVPVVHWIELVDRAIAGTRT